MLSALTGATPESVTGRGGGLTDQAFAVKKQVITQALALHHPDREDVVDVLSAVGGLDLAAMTGGRMAVDIRTEREQKSTKTVVNSLEVWINTITGGNRPYQSHSGGEKVKIALAVTLGLADVKARRAGVQLGMLFIDEPPFLDADGTEAYADALVNMAARNPNMRILAISHDPTMKARFSQNIIVTGGEDGSSVTME